MTDSEQKTERIRTDSERQVLRKFPWARISKDVAGAESAEDAIILGGLDWKVEKKPIFVHHPVSDRGGEMPAISPIEVPDKFAVCRTLDDQPLGVVGNSYELIQNRECFGFFDGVVEEGVADYIAAGQMRNGSRIFIVSRFGESIHIGGDELVKYMVLSSSHDGSAALMVQLMMYRLVCVNGLTGESKHARSVVRIRHTRNYQIQLTQARRVIGIADTYYRHMEKLYRQLFETPMTKEDNLAFLHKLLPPKKVDDSLGAATKKTSDTKRLNTIDAINTLIAHGRGNASLSDTAWATYNGVVEYYDWKQKSRTREGRNRDEVKFESQMTGSAANHKQRALELLTS